MNEEKNIAALLDMMTHPAFSVSGGMVTHCNQSARQLFIEPGMPISNIVITCAPEYADFRDGCLYLMLDMDDQSVGATVRRVGEYDIFVTESTEEQTALQAMALSALQFRLPLSDIGSYLNRLSALKKLDPQAEDALHQISHRLVRLQRLVSNMSDAARFNQERKSQLACIDLGDYFLDLMQHISPLAATAGITLDYRGIGKKLYGNVDCEKLERAVYNMVSNAMKATPKGGTLCAQLTARGKKAYFSLTDPGNGVDDGVLSSIYSRFLRTPGLDRSQDGLGLGLALIRATAVAHGGTVLVDRPAGGGTRITLTLSLRPNDEGILRSEVLRPDYTGERDHGLFELSDVLSPDLFG